MQWPCTIQHCDTFANSVAHFDSARHVPHPMQLRPIRTVLSMGWFMVEMAVMRPCWLTAGRRCRTYLCKSARRR